MAFAALNFPAAFANGVFIGFSGKGGTGPINEENAVGLLRFRHQHIHPFRENSQQGVYNPIGIYSTPNALFIADFVGTCMRSLLWLRNRGRWHWWLPD